MAEFPPHSCGPCPYLGVYEKVAEKKGDYLATNTIPCPDFELNAQTTLNDPHLAINTAYHSPDLNVPPVGDTHETQVQAAVEKAFSRRSLQGRANGLDMVPSREKDCEPCLKEPCPPPKPGECPISPFSLEKCAGVKSTMSIGTPNYGTVKEVEGSKQKPLEAFKDVGFQGVKPCPCEISGSGQTGRGRPQTAAVHSAGGGGGEGSQKTRPHTSHPKAKEKYPCYLPTPADDVPLALEAKMGPIGPWATGRVDWTPLAGMTGTRPVVDKYSIARFGEGEGRKYNKVVLDNTLHLQQKANLVEKTANDCVDKSNADLDKNQEDSTKRLEVRSHELHRWKCEEEAAIASAQEEVMMLEEQRARLKRASAVLMLPESIAGECLERRTGRMDPELVRDIVEEELVKELALTAELRTQFAKALKDVEDQLVEDKVVKAKLEYDWSDKKQAIESDMLATALNKKSNIMMFYPGAVRYSDEQSTADFWSHFTNESINEAEATRQKSVALRGTLDAILKNAARDLKAQADKVDAALTARIACMEEIRMALEENLKHILQKLADVERTILKLQLTLRGADIPLKKAQTRLEMRNHRPRVENCRDAAQFGLMEEVKLIGDTMKILISQLSQAEQNQADLMKNRGELEREIMVKRKTLEIDRDRTALIRSKYPTVEQLEGN